MFYNEKYINTKPIYQKQYKLSMVVINGFFCDCFAKINLTNYLFNCIIKMDESFVKLGDYMKRVLTIKAREGSIVAGDVYTPGGHLVIKKGTVLDKNIIEKLKYYSIFDFFVEEDEFTTYEEDDLERMIFAEKSENLGEEESYYKKIRKTEKFQKFECMFNDSVVRVKDSINDIIYKNSPIDVNALLDDVKKITQEFKPDVHVFDMVHCIEGYDDLTYVHSVNVALIARIIGIWMNFSEKDLDAITLGGLLHDIGKVMIPKEVITKPGRLTPTEYALVQTHPIHGYNILKNQNIDERIKLCALQHHERCDGKGYPYKHGYNDIEPFARIVAIADVYDAMTSNRVYRTGLCPYDVISIFEDSAEAYDPAVLMSVLERIANTYINNEVILNDDLEGKIIMINKNKLGKPVVLVGSAYVDLSKEKSIRIISLK